MAVLEIRHYADPACPWDFSAEPARYRLMWLYGDQLSWRRTMVGLSERPEDYDERGYTPEFLSRGLADIQQRFGMPIDARERPRMLGTMTACRAVVAARLRAPDHEAALLRRFRILTMAGEMTDEPEVMKRAAREAGLDPSELRRWVADPDVERALRDDMAAARDPDSAALHLDHKLADADQRGRGGGRRYTCPSYGISRIDGQARDGAPLRLVLAGFQPVAAYEAAIANLAPELARRPEPESAAEVLPWAGEPLATAEIATVCGIEAADAHAQLARVASIDPLGPDGFWSLPREEAVAA